MPLSYPWVLPFSEFGLLQIVRAIYYVPKIFTRHMFAHFYRGRLGWVFGTLIRCQYRGTCSREMHLVISVNSKGLKKDK